MARKTNKTSHVLNLITNGAPAEPEPKPAETPAAEAAASGQEGAAPDLAGKGQEPAAAQNHAGDRKVIVVDASENDKIADAIRERLEEQVELEEKNAETKAPEAAAAPVEHGTVSADALKDAEDSMMPEAVDMKTNAEAKAEAVEAAAQAAAETENGAGTAGQTAPAKPEKEAPKRHHYRMVNVMEEVTARYNLLDQMGKYGVCTCSRCLADVQALTLTHLPSKYVVVDGNPIAPIIGYYESKYRSRLLTEVMKACILVKEKPRHNRDTDLADMI